MGLWKKTVFIICILILLGSTYYFNEMQFKINQSLVICLGNNGGNANLQIESKGDITIDGGGGSLNVIAGSAGCNNVKTNTQKLQILQIFSLLGVILASIVDSFIIYDRLTRN